MNPPPRRIDTRLNSASIDESSPKKSTRRTKDRDREKERKDPTNNRARKKKERERDFEDGRGVGF